MKDSMSQEDVVRYKNMITSFVNNAIMETDGVAKELSVNKLKLGISTMNTRNIHIYFMDNTVTIDVYVSVIYGYVIPEVVYTIQEKIINFVKSSTHFKVKSVNVNVSNVLFM